MNIEAFRELCMSKKGVEESFPFDQDTLVFKVMGKMFALISLSSPDSCNLKCNPERAITLREQYEGIIPGFHMNKSHWNTVALTADVPNDLIQELITHSYQLVVASLPKKTQALLQ